MSRRRRVWRMVGWLVVYGALGLVEFLAREGRLRVERRIWPPEPHGSAQ